MSLVAPWLFEASGGVLAGFTTLVLPQVIHLRVSVAVNTPVTPKFWHTTYVTRVASAWPKYARLRVLVRANTPQFIDFEKSYGHHSNSWCICQCSWTFICLFRFLVGQSRRNSNKVSWKSWSSNRAYSPHSSEYSILLLVLLEHDHFMHGPTYLENYVGHVLSGPFLIRLGKLQCLSHLNTFPLKRNALVMSSLFVVVLSHLFL